MAAFTGMRRNEVLALRWADLDPENRTLRIERSLQCVRGENLTFGPPKSVRGVRTIAVDPALLSLLLGLREKYQRLIAGVTAEANVDLSLVRFLPKR